MNRPRTGWLLAVPAALLAGPAFAQDVNEAQEKAMKAAASKAAPWVVKIETSGGREVVGGPSAGPGGGGVRKGVGPTTGTIVDKDGYIISSAFNFANNPTDIFVTVPGRPRLVAKRVANDTTRMLTLLKVDAKDLPVPASLAIAGGADPEAVRVGCKSRSSAAQGSGGSLGGSRTTSPKDRTMTRFLQRLGRACATHPWRTLQNGAGGAYGAELGSLFGSIEAHDP